MAIVVALLCLFIGNPAPAGGRYLICKGSIVQMEASAKGPIPMDDVVELRGVEGGALQLQRLIRFEGRGLHDFLMVYQSLNPEADVTAILKKDHARIGFLVYRQGQLIEDIGCSLGF